MSSYKSFAFDINEVFEIQNNGVPDEFIDPDCIGHIRPHDKYAEELGYGFDWMRIGDTTYNGQTEIYKNIMGNLYKSKTERTMEKGKAVDKKVIDCLEADINQYYVKNTHIFEKRTEMYQLLENEYNLASKAKVFIKRQGKLERYYVPILSLQQSGYGGSAATGIFTKSAPLPINKDTIHQAKLKLSLDIKVQPHKLYWEFPEAYRQKKSTPNGPNVDIPIIISPTALPTTAGKHQIDFTVQCNTSINSTIDVKLIAEDRRGKKKLAGAFRIWKNREKRPKIVLINVASDITGSPKEYGEDVLKNRFSSLVRKYLKPSLVCPQIETVKLDMTSSWFHKDLDDFVSRDKKKQLCVLNESPNNPVSLGQLYNRLRDALEDKYDNKYDSYIKIFYIQETAVRYEYDAKASAGKSINSRSAIFKYEPFYAASLNGANTILFTEQSDFDDSVSAHEIYHALGLVHSFSNYDNSPAKPEKPVVADGRYTYHSFETDNVMDYKTMLKPKRSLFGMWWWQWRIVNP